MKKCKFCKAEFTPAKPMQTVCGFACAVDLGVADKQKAQRKAELLVRRADKVKREKLKSRSDYIKECQVVANRYARLRDIKAGYGCVSCGAPYRGAYGGAFDGGHLRSVGSAPHMRFFLPQIALQCVKCNRYLGGNVVEFRRGLVARRGLAFVELVESMQGEGRWSIDYLKRFKRVISKRAKRMEVNHG